MAVKLFKRHIEFVLIVTVALLLTSFSAHPYYMSITEIAYKAEQKELQVACKLFADDFEDVLKAENRKTVAIFNETQKAENTKLINTYLQQHFHITIDGKNGVYTMLGFEKEEEAVWVYFVVKEVSKFKKLNVWSDIFYQYRQGQINIVHFKNKGKTQSFRISSPEVQHTFLW